MQTIQLTFDFLSTDWRYMSIGEEPVMEVEEDYIKRMDYWKHILPRIPEY